MIVVTRRTSTSSVPFPFSTFRWFLPLTMSTVLDSSWILLISLWPLLMTVAIAGWITSHASFLQTVSLIRLSWCSLGPWRSTISVCSFRLHCSWSVFVLVFHAYILIRWLSSINGCKSLTTLILVMPSRAAWSSVLMQTIRWTYFNSLMFLLLDLNVILVTWHICVLSTAGISYVFWEFWFHVDRRQNVSGDWPVSRRCFHSFTASAVRPTFAFLLFLLLLLFLFLLSVECFCITSKMQCNTYNYTLLQNNWF